MLDSLQGGEQRSARIAGRTKIEERYLLEQSHCRDHREISSGEYGTYLDAVYAL